MPSEAANGIASAQYREICKRCKKNAGIYMLRNDLHCRDCYDRYVRSKCVKRMESYKIRPSDKGIPTFLLPLSFGLSSTTLLYFLDSQLQNQRQKVAGTRYKLKILHVDETILGPLAPPVSHLDEIHRIFPDAGEFLAASLEDIYNFKQALPDIDLQRGNGASSNADKFRSMILTLPSATSRMDIAGIVRNRLIVEIAKKEQCAGILWGDTTTKLAQKTLAETAKGRGFSLPWQISDGRSPDGLMFHYPLRDLFKKELVTFASEISELSLIPLCKAYSSEPKHTAAAATSGRNITVDELMTQYFESMEAQYPSIVSNVIRTAARLDVEDQDAVVCRICGLPGDGDSGGLILGSSEEAVSSNGLCYGCLRSTHDATAGI